MDVRSRLFPGSQGAVTGITVSTLPHEHYPVSEQRKDTVPPERCGSENTLLH